MQILDDFRQILLGLIFARDIRKLNAVRRFDIDLGVGFSHAKDH